MKNFETEIEGLRGFAAFTVALWHIFYFKYALDPHFTPQGSLVEVNFAHNSVLLFFILSGYVIGLTNKNAFSFDIALTYLKKRWVRLYPLYFFAIAFAIAIMQGDSFSTITGNLFFLQYLVTDTIKANSVLWTLNFEAIYYLLFIFILAFRPNLWLLTAAVFVLSAFVIVYHQLPIKISDYATGWFFWLSGLIAAWKLDYSALRNRGGLIFSLLILFFATSFIEPDLFFFGQLHLLDKWKWNIINVGDLFAYPICLSLVLLAGNRLFKYEKYLHAIAYGLVGICCAALLITHKAFESPVYIFGIGLFLVSLIFRLIKTTFNLFHKITWLGSVSYAVYILHVPVMNLIGKITIASGNLFTFTVRAVVFIAITLLMSWVLEIKLQPLIRSFFLAKRN